MYPRGQYPQASVRFVGDGYFHTMGIPILAGREFSDADRPESELVVVVNELLAHMLWPNRDAVGQVLMRGSKRLRVVGVVGDVRHDALEHAFTGEAYYPMRQFGDYSAINLIVRTEIPEAQLASSVRAALQPIAPEAAKHEWRTLQQLIDKVASPRRFVVMLLGGFTAFALILAALGIYAVISYGVTQRTQEIGIRLALGASSSEVRASIMRGTLALAGAGMLVGIAAAVVLVPSLSGMLFGVTWTDPVSFAGALAGCSSWLPRQLATSRPGGRRGWIRAWRCGTDDRLTRPAEFAATRNDDLAMLAGPPTLSPRPGLALPGQCRVNLSA